VKFQKASSGKMPVDCYLTVLVRYKGGFYPGWQVFASASSSNSDIGNLVRNLGDIIARNSSPAALEEVAPLHYGFGGNCELERARSPEARCICIGRDRTTQVQNTERKGTERGRDIISYISREAGVSCWVDV